MIYQLIGDQWWRISTETFMGHMTMDCRELEGSEPFTPEGVLAERLAIMTLARGGTHIEDLFRWHDMDYEEPLTIEESGPGVEFIN